MKKLVSILCALVMVLSLSAAAFAKTPDAGFDPAAILDPEPEVEEKAEEEPAVETIDSFVATCDGAVSAIRGACSAGAYLSIPLDQGYARCFVDPDGERDANGLLPIVRIDVFPSDDPEVSANDYIKSYYYVQYEGQNALFCAHYRTNHYEWGDQNYFYFGEDNSTDPATNGKLLVLKYRPFGEKKFNVIVPEEIDAGYDQIEAGIKAESDKLLADATTRLTALHNMGLY